MILHHAHCIFTDSDIDRNRSRNRSRTWKVIRMSDLKELQSKVRTEVYQRFGKIDYDSNIDAITAELATVRAGNTSDDDFIKSTVQTINAVYGYPNDHNEVVVQTGDKQYNLPAWVLDRRTDEDKRPNVWGMNH